MALIHIDTSDVALIHMRSHATPRAHSRSTLAYCAHAPRLTLVAVAETCLQLERLIMRRGEVYKSEEARYREGTVLYIRIAQYLHNTPRYAVADG